MRRSSAKSALVLVHVQEDVVMNATNREQVLANIAKLQSRASFGATFVVLRWHPARHCSFTQNHPGAEAGEIRYILELGDTQRLRNEECVAGTPGVAPLQLEISSHLVFTGTDPRRDAYSAFKDAGSEKLTSMYKTLHAMGVDELFICGDTDAVRFTAMDACSFLADAQIHVITDACTQNAATEKRALGTEDAHNPQYHIKYDLVDDVIAHTSRPAIVRKHIESKLSGGGPAPAQSPRSADTADDEEALSVLDETVLMLAGSPETLLTTRRLDMLADVNAPSSFCKRTILHACCWSGNVAAIDVLRVARPEVDPLCADDRGFTPLALTLLFAPRASRAEVVKRLLAISPRLRTSIPLQRFAPSQQTALMLACESGDADVAALLLEEDDSEAHVRCIDAFGRTAIMLALSQETGAHNRVTRTIIESTPLHLRLGLLAVSDSGGWNALHYSARSGAFAHLSWPKILGNASYLSDLPINALTQGGFSFLHLAAANGKFEVIRTLVELSGDVEPPFDRLTDIIRVNLTVNAPLARTAREQRKTELDLAIQHRHLETARMLLRIGCHASAERGVMQELLHRLVLMGDVEACENILAFSTENDIRIDHALVALTKRIEAPETCTSRCADFKPILQFMYHCPTCDVDVCLVCRERCHASCARDLEPKGFGLALCECSSRDRWACHAMTSTDPRERAAMAFDPSPLDTTIVRLSASTEALARRLARNMHNVWCKIKLDQGWKYSRTRDDAQRLHPALVPFENLAPEDAKYNMNMCTETVKLIILLGFRLEPPSEAQLANQQKSSPSGALTARGRHESLKYADEQWDESKPGCVPIDTTKAPDIMSKHLEELIHCISVNSHEVWAREKISQGWRYAPHRNIARNLKLNPSLVPYAQLDEDERNALRQGVEQTIKSVMSLGWHIEPVSEVATANILRRTQQRAARASTDMTCERIAYHNVDEMRVQLLSSYLLAAVRRGHLDSINIILSNAAQNDGADLNTTDRHGRSALSIAVLGGHYATARHLLALHVDANAQDRNGFSALALAAYVGDLKMLKLLLEAEVDVDVLLPDHLGFTAVHHAAAQGHSRACEFLVRYLQQLYQADEVVNLNFHGVASLELASKVSRRRTSIDHDGAVSTAAAYPPGAAGPAVTEVENLDLACGLAPEVGTDRSPADSPSPDANNKRTVQNAWTIFGSKPRRTSVHPMRRRTAAAAAAAAAASALQLSRFSPLSLAVQNGQLGTVESLIRLAANPILEEDPEFHDVTYSSYFRALAQHIRIGDDVQRVRAEIQDRSLSWTFRAAGLSRAYQRRSFSTVDETAKITKKVSQYQPQHQKTREVDHFLPDSLASKTQRELQLTLRDLETWFAASTMMVGLLNKALPVRRWRNQHALRQFFRETTVLLALLIVFAAMVQLAPDYNVKSERMWRVSLTRELAASLSEVNSFAAMQDWIAHGFPSLLRYSSRDGLFFLEFNRIVGAVRLQHVAHYGHSSHMSWHQASSVDILALPSNTTYTLVPQRPVQEMATLLAQRARLMDVDGLESFKMEMNVHNPLHNMHGIINVGISTSFYGSSSLELDVRDFRIDYGRFPPSRAFQLTLVCMVTVLLLLLARFKKYRTRKTPALLVVAVFLLIGVLSVDLYAYNNTRNLKESLGPADFALWDTHYLVLQMERRAVAALFFLSIIPLLQSARAIPNIGPVVVALINTFGNLAVRIYLVVVAAACFLLSFTFHVGFGSSVEAWGTVPSTFYSLFYTPFIETWDTYNDISSTSWSGLFAAACFILFATINLNLLIAIVTDVYPKEREASDSMWEQLVTAGIEMRLRAYNKRRFHLQAAEILYWEKDKVLPAVMRPSSSTSPTAADAEGTSSVEDSTSSALHGLAAPAHGPSQDLAAQIRNHGTRALDADRVAMPSAGSFYSTATASSSSQSERVLEKQASLLESLEKKISLLVDEVASVRAVAQASASSALERPAIDAEIAGHSRASPRRLEQKSATPTIIVDHKVAQEEQSVDVNDALIRQFLQATLASGSARLSMIKDSIIAHGWSWERAKELRRGMGILQHKQTLENGQVIRLWDFARGSSPGSSP